MARCCGRGSRSRRAFALVGSLFGVVSLLVVGADVLPAWLVTRPCAPPPPPPHVPLARSAEDPPPLPACPPEVAAALPPDRPFAELGVARGYCGGEILVEGDADRMRAALRDRGAPPPVRGPRPSDPRAYLADPAALDASAALEDAGGAWTVKVDAENPAGAIARLARAIESGVVRAIVVRPGSGDLRGIIEGLAGSMLRMRSLSPEWIAFE